MVRFGTGRYADVEHTCLMTDEVTPLASPAYIRENGPFDTRRSCCPPSSSSSPLEPWRTWFLAHGVDARAGRGLLVQRHRPDVRRRRPGPGHRACCPRQARCCWHADTKTPRPTNATASPPTASARWWWRCPRPRSRWQAVLKTCHALEVPVVARGAGTGLSGGAMPHALGVTLSLAKFNRILKVDPLAAPPWCSAACATWPSARPPRRTACTTRPTRPARSPAPSAATWPRTPAACTA
jgi:hypothetical protein